MHVPKTEVSFLVSIRIKINLLNIGLFAEFLVWPKFCSSILGVRPAEVDVSIGVVGIDL